MPQLPPQLYTDSVIAQPLREREGAMNSRRRSQHQRTAAVSQETCLESDCLSAAGAFHYNRAG